MQKAISKYGLAAHLALLAAAPLFLYPFCGEVWTARALLWLSLLSVVWMFMEPSRRKGEMLHDARLRVFLAVVGDPLFWLSAVLTAIAAIRLLNGGVAMVYDAETMQWSLRRPHVPFLPGGLDAAGYLPFSAVVASAVIMQTCRHALGKSARVCFLFVASFLSGLSAIALSAAMFCGDHAVLSAALAGAEDASYIGNAFGLHLAGGLVALAGAFERKWKRTMPFLIVSIGGCGVGLYSFAPDFVIVAYSAAAALVFSLALLYAQSKVGGLVLPKSLAFLLISAAAGLLVVMGLVPAAVKEVRFAWLFQEGGRLLSDGFLAARDALSSIAASVWRGHPWTGTGLGSFPLDIRFEATPEMWRIFPASQKGCLNGWWQLLAERGISGAIFFLSPLAFLLWTFVVRGFAAAKDAVRRRRGASGFVFHPVCWLGPVAVAATAACGFFDHSFWRAETMMAVVAMFAMSGPAFPAVANQAGSTGDGEVTNG